MSGFLDGCRSATGSDAEFVWVSEEFLLGRGVAFWSELPLWVAAEHEGLQRIDSSKAVNSGLAFRPLMETVGDVLAWDLERPESRERGSQMSREREAQLLGEWRGKERSRGKTAGC